MEALSIGCRHTSWSQSTKSSAGSTTRRHYHAMEVKLICSRGRHSTTAVEVKVFFFHLWMNLSNLSFLSYTWYSTMAIRNRIIYFRHHGSAALLPLDNLAEWVGLGLDPSLVPSYIVTYQAIFNWNTPAYVE